jgi:hypothetical protein
MADEFADRVREATVDDRLLDIPKLKEAAAAASTNLNGDRALALVLAAHHQSLPPADDVELRQRINSSGPVVEAAGENQLLAVLAGEALILAFERERAGVVLIPGLGVRCAAHAGWRPVHADLTSAAAAYLLRRAHSLRNHIPLESRLTKEKPKSEDGTAALALEEIEVLRGYVQHDRQRLWERDQVAWWLRSESRPESSLALAQEYARCLWFLPEPPATREMIAAKLAQPNVSEPPELTQVEIDPAISGLCPDLRADPEPLTGERDVHEVLRLLDQVMLARAFVETRK